MDSKINKHGLSVKRSISVAVCILSALAVFLPSCKENKWLDWKTQNEIWLEHNKHLPDVYISSTGLQYKIIADPGAKNGEAKPNQTSTIVCDYTVKLINGYTVSSGKGVSLYLPNTIPGFSEGCHKIHTHGDIELYIPAYLGYDNEKYENDKYNEAEGYGTEGTTGYIPPYSALIYSIHICGVTSN